ncbi:hypothetical protein [Cupriavidus metallidurans]|uniref:hypothetical protein n=1 Tax=Cupriavidus metallidurans TaxID=119219 RepID=UPI001D13236D|nr:hypothetical protein [Cupriavidus metallidurans]
MARMFSRVNVLLINVVFDFKLNIMFNQAMNAKPTAVHADWQLIESLGGPAQVAKLLGYDLKKGGIQRVHNWRVRGVPPSVKLAHPSLFLKELTNSQDASDDVQPPVGTSSHRAKKKVRK